MSTPLKQAPETDSAAYQALYQFLRDKIRPEHLQYLRKHCESQAELDQAIESLRRKHAMMTRSPGVNYEEPRRWSDYVNTRHGG